MHKSAGDRSGKGVTAVLSWREPDEYEPTRLRAPDRDETLLLQRKLVVVGQAQQPAAKHPFDLR
jgi:hypothetical protein